MFFSQLHKKGHFDNFACGVESFCFNQQNSIVMLQKAEKLSTEILP
jgi:hypothetical protein